MLYKHSKKKDMLVFIDLTVQAPKKLYLARVLAASGKHICNFSLNLYLVTVNTGSHGHIYCCQLNIIICLCM